MPGSDENISSVFSALYQAQVDVSPDTSFKFRVKRLLAKLRSLRLKVGDPFVEIRVGARKLVMPLSHRLPLLLSENRFYDRVLVRLVEYLKKTQGEIVAIDVGANIGDTAALLVDAGADEVICIEADAFFYEILVRNWRDDATVRCRKVALADTGNMKLATEHYQGTAHLRTNDGAGASTKTLDEVVLEFSPARIDVLKIDTDGFDFRVLRGAEGTLRRFKPAVFFEYSPEHYEKIGGVNPVECFSYLAMLGYTRIAIYDSAGVLMLEAASDDLGLLEQLSRYAEVSGLYYDILAFHEEHSRSFAVFMAGERAFFPKFDRPYLQRSGTPADASETARA